MYSEGDVRVPAEDYTSHNTRRLNVDEVEEVLLQLPEVRLQAGMGSKSHGEPL